ncbi:MAG: hypothetical protein IPP65_13240 [Chlorobi bacterium]|nr:hypothetical protein [Chlorobiota bacterium]
MNQLTLKIDKNIILFSNQCIEVEINEEIKDNNILLIYSVVHGIILVNGIQIVPQSNTQKIVLHIKNNTEHTIILTDKSIIANFLEIKNEKETKTKNAK